MVGYLTGLFLGLLTALGFEVAVVAFFAWNYFI